MKNVNFMKKNFSFIFILFIMMILSYLKINATYTGASGTVFDDDQYLTFTAADGSVGISFTWGSNSQVHYRHTDDNSWSPYTKGATIRLESNESIQFKANNIKINENLNEVKENHFEMTGEGKVLASGSVDSLRVNSSPDGDAFQGLEEKCYNGLFYGCEKLVSSPQLIATTLAPHCYNSMFRGCTGLEIPPALPASNLEPYCYDSMFAGCANLTEAPDLLANTLADHCYNYMFHGCTRLTNAPDLPANNLASNCYKYMFDGCTNLTGIPNLPATSLSSRCYMGMFNGCSSLETLPIIRATSLASDCYTEMFSGCTSLKLTKQQNKYKNRWALKIDSNTGYDTMFDKNNFSPTELTNNDDLDLSTNVNNNTLTLYYRGPIVPLKNRRDLVIDGIPRVNNGILSELEIKYMDEYGNKLSIDDTDENEQAYITIMIKKNGVFVASSEIFNVVLREGKTILPAQPLYINSSGEASSSISEIWNDETPMVYYICVIFIGTEM